MPEVSKTLLVKYKVENCFYGEFIDMMNPDKGWILDASEPRYMSNYYGIRNRLGILNENYVYADFKSRVMGCYYLINSLIEYASGNKSEIKTLLADADKKTIQRGSDPAVTDSFAIEYKVRPLPDKITVRTYEAERTNDSNVYFSYKRTDRQKDVTVPYFIDFYAAKSVKFPYAYIITTPDPKVTGLLKMHGIKMEKLTADTGIEVQRFIISSLKGSPKLNQGHYTNTISGTYNTEKIDFPAGTIVVRTAQPLGNLAAYLLEPQSDDGLTFWNYLDRYLVPQWGMGFNPFPVCKVLNKTELSTKPVI
jgi:hypothetical protein